jgi:hypothetical protein
MHVVSEVLIDQMLITMGSHISTFVASGGRTVVSGEWLVASVLLKSLLLAVPLALKAVSKQP